MQNKLIQEKRAQEEVMQGESAQNVSGKGRFVQDTLPRHMGSPYYIDKTEQLEKGIVAFPSIYIEGSAASGKSVAVQMLFNAHPEMNVKIFHLEEEWQQADLLLKKINDIRQELKTHDLWIFFDNIPESSSSGCYMKTPHKNEQEDHIFQAIVQLVKTLPADSKVIFTSRGKPEKLLLELLWKRKMELIVTQELLFTRGEVRNLAQQWESKLDYRQVYEKTGGWPGCVDLLFRLADQEKRHRAYERNVDELLGSYEVRSYISQEILSKLSEDEKQLASYAADCPWINSELCSSLWNWEEPNTEEEKKNTCREIVENLVRKGILLYDRTRKRCKIHPLFFSHLSKSNGDWQEKAADWYVDNGYVKEALLCLKKSRNSKAYRKQMLTHYDKVPFLGLDYKEVKEWTDRSAPACYLRGMYYYSIQNFTRLNKEIQNVEKISGKSRQIQEILLNLYFVKPDFPLDQWMEMLERFTKSAETVKFPESIKSAETIKKTENGKDLEKSKTTEPVKTPEMEKVKFRLYNMLGDSCTFLCGYRDLSGLFACMKKEETRQARIWKECLGKREWKAYQLARLDFYLETGRRSAVREEDRTLLEQETAEEIISEKESGKDSGDVSESFTENWQFSLARFYLLNKLQALDADAGYAEKIHRLEKKLVQEENKVCIRNTAAITALYASLYGEQERTIRWLRDTAQEGAVEVKESSYLMLYCQVKLYLILEQYKQADKILKRLIPHLQNYHRSRFLAELLFQQSVSLWSNEGHNMALRNTIESFLVTGSSRYVVFYTEYGKKGREVLESYIEWMRNNSPEKWHRKKKYNYGNVLRMPVEDYLEVILRNTRKNISKDREKQEYVVREKLTLMEISVLQSIGHGMTNEQICEELDLRLPTVKSHIYNLYKKLGVKNRVQAILKGKELGMLE